MDKEDWISSLPDENLSQILSFLELREAVRTSVLSKRWEKVWTWIHRIYLNNQLYLGKFCRCCSPREESKLTTSFVNEILTAYNNRSVTSFSLSCCCFDQKTKYLTQWIAAAMPHTLYQCQKLIILEFSNTCPRNCLPFKS